MNMYYIEKLSTLSTVKLFCMHSQIIYRYKPQGVAFFTYWKPFKNVIPNSIVQFECSESFHSNALKYESNKMQIVETVKIFKNDF